ncbi:MAG: asparagine synthase (glutamine-hydrolyzing), partial [Actinobacteria bacterium]|nr:asparagine synthase (glutamine-hydrolyzing) [Actinomycetota bacterium]
MCGICGSTHARDGRALAAMNAAMVHRGPDDDGIYVDPAAGVGLGARRLSIIDVAGGHQPLSSEDGSIWAVLNGEIYNHPRLMDGLASRGHTLATRTDTEVLVHLYEDYGAELVHALEGMYVFAIWDARRRVLLLGRDRFGEKPLFYSERAGVLTFASELSALVQGLESGWEVDEAAVDSFFVFGYVPGERAIVRGVQQLPPGHLLVWDGHTRSSSTQRYWAPPRMPADGNTPLPELVAETRRLLEASVRSRLISDVPLGVFLSGGVDSTLVAAVAAGLSSEPLRTFTVGYDTGTVNETDPARRVAALLGADHRELMLTESDVAALVPRFLAELDQPLADEAYVPLRALAEFARESVTVAVGGEGADELFGGYPRYRWLARSERLPDWLPRERAARAARVLERAPAGARVKRLREVMSADSVLERHVDWVTGRRAALRPSVYGGRLRPYADGRGFLELPRGGGLEGDGRVEGDFMRLDQLRWLPDDILAKADRATMRASLEFRTPFLHRELAELAASIPASTHVAGGGKRLLRQV